MLEVVHEGFVGLAASDVRHGANALRIVVRLSPVVVNPVLWYPGWWFPGLCWRWFMRVLSVWLPRMCAMVRMHCG